jgi:hypothetical protein
MSATDHAPIELHCHADSACASVQALNVTVRAHAGQLLFGYTLTADLKRLRIPAAHPAVRAHELWRHSCFEAFVAQAGSPGYCELNFAPSQAWALYRFSGRRQGMQIDTDARAPEVTVRHTATGLILEASVFILDLIPAGAPLGLRLGLAAVLEDRDGRLSYWAARHPPGKPDFHHPDSFTLELAP